MMGPEVKLRVFFLIRGKKEQIKTKSICFLPKRWPGGKRWDRVLTKRTDHGLGKCEIATHKNCSEILEDLNRKKLFFKNRTKTNRVWKSDMPAINKQLLVDKDVSDRLLSNHFRHYNQFGDWLKSRLSDWCSPPRQVFLFRNPSTCIFKNFRGYSRIVKDTQGFSRIFKDIQGYSRIFKDFQGFSRIFKDFQGFGGFWRILKDLGEKSSLPREDHMLKEATCALNLLTKYISKKICLKHLLKFEQ